MLFSSFACHLNQAICVSCLLVSTMRDDVFFTHVLRIVLRHVTLLNLMDFYTKCHTQYVSHFVLTLFTYNLFVQILYPKTDHYVDKIMISCHVNIISTHCILPVHSTEVQLLSVLSSISHESVLGDVKITTDEHMRLENGILLRTSWIVLKTQQLQDIMKRRLLAQRVTDIACIRWGVKLKEWVWERRNHDVSADDNRSVKRSSTTL